MTIFFLIFVALNIFFTKSVGAVCTVDYSGINGNVINNPKFECDEDSDSIPDGWYKRLPDENHILSLVDDPTDSGYGKVLKSQYVDNGNDTDFGWMASENIILEQNSWYELEITYLTENTGINLTAGNLIDVTSSWLGVAINRYTSDSIFIYFPLSSIFPSVQHFTSWDEEDKLYRTYSSVNSSGWVTKKMHFKTSNLDAYATPRTYHYPPGTFYLAEYSLKKTSGNINPENVNLDRSGTLSPFTFRGESFFPIILNYFPKSGGQDVDIDQLADYGFNTFTDIYRTYTTNEYQAILSQKNLATIVHVNCLPWSNEFDCYWGNDPSNLVNYLGYDIALSHLDEWTNFENLLLFDALLDEMDCNPQDGQTFIGYLDTYNSLINYIRANSSVPIYGNFCGGTYTRDYDDEVDYYLPLADVFSFTQNLKNAYNIGTGPNSGTAGLPDVGFQIRQAANSMQTAGTPKKILAFGLGTYWWASWNGNTYNSNTYIPFTLQRFQIWDQIINGATGVLFFLQNVNLDNDYYNHQFNQIASLATELDEMKFVLMEPDYYDEWLVSDSRVEIMMKKYSGRIYLFVASTAQEDLTNVTITLDSKYTIKSITALNDFPNGDYTNPEDRQIAVTNSFSFSDNFTGENSNSPQGLTAPGYGTHIYEISYTDTYPGPVDSNTSNQVCSGDPAGTKPSFIYGAIPQSLDTIKLFFTEASEPTTKYVLEYGTKSGEYLYGVPDMGINKRHQMTFDIHSLKPNTRYYFRIRSDNGCITGPISNEISTITAPVRLSSSIPKPTNLPIYSLDTHLLISKDDDVKESVTTEIYIAPKTPIALQTWVPSTSNKNIFILLINYLKKLKF